MSLLTIQSQLVKMGQLMNRLSTWQAFVRIPNLNVFRPADARETQAAWYLAVTSEKTPTALVLTRQNLTVEDGTDFDKVAKGAYVVYENAADFDTILIATGSEVNLAVSAAKELASQGVKVRVVSMPSTDVFDAQDAATRKKSFQMQFAVVLQSKWVQLKLVQICWTRWCCSWY